MKYDTAIMILFTLVFFIALLVVLQGRHIVELEKIILSLQK